MFNRQPSNRDFHQVRANLLLQLALIWHDRREAGRLAALAGQHLDLSLPDDGKDDLERIPGPPLAPT